MLIFRSGIPLVVPDDYATQPGHQALVDMLQRGGYKEAVLLLEHHTDSYLAADVLNGATWAQRYLNTTARLWYGSAGDKILARRGQVALMAVLAGIRPRRGRRRHDPLSPLDSARGGLALARFRDLVSRHWGDQAALVASVHPSLRARLRPLLVRRGVRPSHVALSLAAWETGIPLRRLRAASPVADVVFG